MPKKKRVRVVIDVQKLGRLGGLARAAKMSAKDRSAAARKAVNARWAKAKSAPGAASSGARGVRVPPSKSKRRAGLPSD